MLAARYVATHTTTQTRHESCTFRDLVGNLVGNRESKLLGEQKGQAQHLSSMAMIYATRTSRK